jgi:hypothetical protein
VSNVKRGPIKGGADSMNTELQRLLRGSKISREDFSAVRIEKLELLDGDLCGGEALDLLKILIRNVGLMRTLDLFPREYWLKALEGPTKEEGEE